MAVQLGAIFASAVVSQVVSAVIGNFFGRYGVQEGKTLDTFLATLSTDFVHRVENVVRNAFTEQNFLELKVDLRSASSAFRTYVASQALDESGMPTAFADESELRTACVKIHDARSRIFALNDNLIAVDPVSFMLIADPAQKGSVISQRHKALESAMASLQAVAALDLLVSAKKAEQFPATRAEIVTRVGEYHKMADKLKQTYLTHQNFRSWVSTDLYNKGMDGGGHYCCFTATRFVDGVVTENTTQKHLHVHGNDVAQYKQNFQLSLARKYGNDHSLEIAANTTLSAEGNIEAAMRTWTAVRDVFAA